MKSVLITGANRGFGRALFDIYSHRGWQMFPLVRRAEAARELIRAAKSPCFPILADVTAPNPGEAITRVLATHTKTLDVLINNAGFAKKISGILTISANDLVEHFQVHCCGVLETTRAAFPFLKQAAAPLVINISSRKGSLALNLAETYDRAHPYRIAKCAQNMLTVSLDQELRPLGIPVFAVHPGRLITDAAPPDADTRPEIAAEKLVNWIEQIDRTAPCALYDIMHGTVLPW